MIMLMQIWLRIGRIRNAYVWPNIHISTRNNKGKYGAHAQTSARSPIDKSSLSWSGSVDSAAAVLLFAWGENGILVVGGRMSVQVVSGGTVPPGSGWRDSPSR
jgi:hypothetical protein